MSDKCNEILDFWFGDHSSHGFPDYKQRQRWFSVDTQFDELIRKRFGKDIEAAANGQYDHWCAQATGRLALIILLDQFTRNIYRGTAQAFTYDEQAVQLCLAGLELGHDQQLNAAQRMFYYLPLEHSECLSHQKLCLQLFQQLYRESDPAIADILKVSLDFARQHLEIIERFGRFPHRNAALGRVSTEQERLYLEQTGTHFGQGQK